MSLVHKSTHVQISTNIGTNAIYYSKGSMKAFLLTMSHGTAQLLRLWQSTSLVKSDATLFWMDSVVQAGTPSSYPILVPE